MFAGELGPEVLIIRVTWSPAGERRLLSVTPSEPLSTAELIGHKNQFLSVRRNWAETRKFFLVTVKNLTFLGNLENRKSGTRANFLNLPKGEMNILVIEKWRRKRFPFWSQTNLQMFLEPLLPCGLSFSIGWSGFLHRAISGPQRVQGLAKPSLTECHSWFIFLVKASYGFTS